MPNTTPNNQPPQRSTRKTGDNIRIHNILPDVERTFLPIGTMIGKYRIIEEIDRGGMAVVYKALQMDLDRIVALKVLPANITINRRFVERFLSEAHAIARLSHPHIVSIHEVSMENNIYFLAMDYIPGQNLYYYLNLQKPKLLEVIEITSKLVEAMTYAHSQKIIHRDLKLNNVIMKDNASPVLIDFGLAKAMGTPSEEGMITKTGEIMGSPAYMAPERVTGGNVDDRSDICSVGIMLYEMLTFKNPYLDPRSIQQTTLNVIEAHPLPPRKFVPWLPSEVEAITLKAMHKDQEKRYQSMEEFGQDLKRYQRGERVLAQPPSLWSNIKYLFKKNWAPIVIGSLILLFAIVSSVSVYQQSKREKSHWQLVYSEDFTDSLQSAEWHTETTPLEVKTPAQKESSKKAERSRHAKVKKKPKTVKVEPRVPPSPIWKVENGRLLCIGGQSSYIRLQKEFTRDTRVEFDVAAESLDFFDAGFFMYGENPDSGYCFHIHYNGNGDNGISLPATRFLFSNQNLIQFPLSRKYHVSIERKNNLFTYKLNEILVERFWDFYPHLGKSFQNIGFFTRSGAFSIDNIQIYRSAIPQLPGPSLIADYLWEHGDLSTALEEYNALMVDFPKSDMLSGIMLKAGDCALRNGNFNEAEGLLRSVVQDKTTRNDDNTAMALFLLGLLHSAQGKIDGADSLFAILASSYPASPVNYSAFIASMQHILGDIAGGQLESAQLRTSMLARSYPKQSGICGEVQLKIIEQYIELGSYERALDIGRRTLFLYNDNADISARCRTLLGQVFLCKGDRASAIDMLNKCVAGDINSKGVWDAWMMLAEVYESDRNFIDAQTVYRKIYADCSKSIDLPYLAKIKVGELEFNLSSPKTAYSTFNDVATILHPFPLPRLIARFYLGQMSEQEFIERWRGLNGNNPWYLRYCAQRNVMYGALKLADQQFKLLAQQLYSNSWHFAYVVRLQKSIATKTDTP